MLGIRIDMILSGLRPALLIQGFRKLYIWKPGPSLDAERRKGLLAFMADGAAAAFSDNLAANFLEIYMLALGAGNRAVGTMAALANLAGFLSLAPGVAAIKLAGGRKPVVLLAGGGLGRLGLFGIAIAPFLFPDPAIAIPAVIGFQILRVFMGNFSNPAWTGMVADLVPEASRGGYFASRSALVAIVGAGATLSAGFMAGFGNRVSGTAFSGYSLVFAIAFAFGMLSTWCFSHVPDYWDRSATAKRSFAELGRLLLHYPLFIGFVAFSFIWNFGIFLAAPFFNVFMVRELGATPAAIGVVTMMGGIIQILALPLWGKFIDKHDNLRVLQITGLIIPMIPVAWSFTTAIWHPALINLASGFIWAGFNLAQFNLLLKMLPEEDRQQGAAVYQGLVILSTVLGPIVGTMLVDTLGYRPTFVASGVFRALALLVFFRTVVRRLRRQ